MAPGVPILAIGSPLSPDDFRNGSQGQQDMTDVSTCPMPSGLPLLFRASGPNQQAEGCPAQSLLGAAS